MAPTVENLGQPADVILGTLQKAFPSAVESSELFKVLETKTGCPNLIFVMTMEYLVREQLVKRIQAFGSRGSTATAYALNFSLH